MPAVLRESQSEIFLRLVDPIRYSKNHYDSKLVRNWFSEGLS